MCEHTSVNVYVEDPHTCECFMRLSRAHGRENKCLRVVWCLLCADKTPVFCFVLCSWLFDASDGIADILCKSRRNIISFTHSFFFV